MKYIRFGSRGYVVHSKVVCTQTDIYVCSVTITQTYNNNDGERKRKLENKD